LCGIHHPDAIPDILALLKDRNRNIRMSAISALGEMDSPVIPAALRPFMSDEDPSMRIPAARVLALRGDPAALPVIREFSKDRQMANDYVGYFGFYDSKEITSELVEILKSQGPGAQAARAILARRGNIDALKEIEAQLKHENEWARRNAASILALAGR